MEEMLKSNGITFNHLRSLSLYDDRDEVMPINMVFSCPHTYKLQLSGIISKNNAKTSVISRKFYMVIKSGLLVVIVSKIDVLFEGWIKWSLVH